MIGGGPAGLIAAGTAALEGASVTLLEKGPMTGRKLRLTGKGRCNITNSAPIARFIEAFGPNGKFLYGAFSRFSNQQTLALMEEIGVRTKEERGGRIFPVSDSAVEVSLKLNDWAVRCGAAIKTGTRVSGIEAVDGQVRAVEIFGGKIPADAAILCTGGLSYPKTGSNGEGYEIARRLGHSIIEPNPALSALNTVEKWVRDVQGLTLKNVEAEIWPAGAAKPLRSEFGEMLFTHFGVSGPIVLTLSRWVPALLQGGQPPELKVDLKPAVPEEELDGRLVRDFSRNLHFRNYLKELVPQALADVLPRIVKIDPQKPVSQITAMERSRLVSALKGLTLHVRSMRPIEEAIVTAGGICLKEVDPRTMESKRVQGLYFSGEVLDIDAETGGYNLQAAFSTGFVAGKSAASVLRRPDR